MQNITIQFEQDKPLYQQLYAALANDIRAGHLAAGEKLPSKRRLSEQLRVGLNTVDAAYQMLVAEGYLLAKARSGYTVCRLEALPTPGRQARSAGVETAAGAASKREADAHGFSEEAAARAGGRAGCARDTSKADSASRPHGANSMESASSPHNTAPTVRYSFETAGVDTALFPFKTWRRLGRDLLVGDPSLLNPGHRQGDAPLREAIATHLHEFRGAQCAAHQIVVGAGIEYLLGLLARLFAGERFAVENPGYARTHRILENNGARVAFVPLDAGGMSVQALAHSGASLAYVTPSHQFPTGVTMPVGRRTELLHWAAQAPERYLIEDDYDSEFRFDGKPIPALQGLDDGGHVIYISTFSKSIAPAIRIGYMVLPETLLARYQAEFGFYSCTVSRFEQQTLCRFMEGGYFARHLARLRIAYRQRRDALVAALTAAFGATAQISGGHTGLHLLLTVHNGMTQRILVETAAQQGVRVAGLGDYAANPGALAPSAAQSPTVVLGYAALPPEEIAGAVAALQTAWKKQ